ncbi:hypothetical protein Y032_0014g2387 [Ancylostoma ceylanicum]|uniref:Uncharacterized protein n=1 Tax=Ancylostoma ceylanicum TaxID=53326 RepID=A0A016VAB6_9BILA|nr:hypothetical protein Y032_0014g2387 [Ancylostoma ceylanicum]
MRPFLFRILLVFATFAATNSYRKIKDFDAPAPMHWTPTTTTRTLNERIIRKISNFVNANPIETAVAIANLRRPTGSSNRQRSP